MLSPSDTILIFVVALLLFGPEQVPKIARQLGDAMRHVQNTTGSFMAEMDRAAAAAELKSQPVWEPPAAPSWESPPEDATQAPGAESDTSDMHDATPARPDVTPDAAPRDARPIDQSQPPA